MQLLQRAILISLLLLPTIVARSQTGGRTSFSFLDNPAGARLAALGGSNISSPGTDGTMLQANPALLQPAMMNRLTLSYADFLADVAMSSVFYALEHQRLGRWGVGLQYQGYGNFTQTDPTGQVTGKFTVQDYVLGISHATTLKPFTLGATLKFALSGIAEFKSVAALVDLGGVYKHPEKELYLALALKNVGYQIKTYNGEPRETMPFDAQLGVTYKPEHMPMRLSVTAHHLQKFDIVYQDTAQRTSLTLSKSKVTFGEKLARHFVVGGELLLNKNIHISLGYNHFRRQELRLETKSGGAGLSVGASVRVKAFELTFTRAYYHVAGVSNGFTVVTHIPQVFRKKAGA